jgi:hypothetical protein
MLPPAAVQVCREDHELLATIDFPYGIWNPKKIVYAVEASGADK